MNQADISVIIPTYQRASTVVTAVKSVLEQTLRPAQVIVVDDGSTDGTYEILRKEFGLDILLIRQENGGVASARNTGLKHANQKYVGFLDSDDLWLPHMLETLVPVIQKDPELVVLYSNYYMGFEDKRGRFIKLGYMPSHGKTRLERPARHLLSKNGSGILLQSSIVRRDACVEIGGFDEAYQIAEDTKFFLSLALLGPFAVWNEPLIVKLDEDSSEKLTQPTSERWRLAHARMILSIFAELGSQIFRDDWLAFLRMQRLIGYFRGKLCVEAAKQRDFNTWLRFSLSAVVRGQFRSPVKSLIILFRGDTSSTAKIL